MLKFSAGLTHDDFFGEIAFVVGKDAERGVSPYFAVLHLGIRVEAAHTGDGVGIAYQLLEA
jgi:hypothetical protein